MEGDVGEERRRRRRGNEIGSLRFCFEVANDGTTAAAAAYGFTSPKIDSNERQRIARRAEVGLSIMFGTILNPNITNYGRRKRSGPKR